MGVATYYLNDPSAPKPNMPIHLGANLLIEYQGKLLLEQRSDCDLWGLIGGGRKKGESALQNAVRELYEETGLRLPLSQLSFVKTYDSPGRIASYRDGSVWAMVISVFHVRLDSLPALCYSKESTQLRFFSPQELVSLPVVVTHSDIISDYLSKAAHATEKEVNR